MDIDKLDRIWLAYKSGLCYYNQRAQHFVRIPAAGAVISLVYDKKSDAIWFNRRDGLYKLTLADMQVQATRLRDYPQNPQAINIDSRNNLWIAIERNYSYRYDIKTDTFQITSSFWALSFDEDTDGNLWTSTWSNGFLYDNRDSGHDFETRHDLPIDPNGVPRIFQGMAQSIPLTGKNILWVATHNAGVSLFDKQKMQFVKTLRYDPLVRNGIINDFNSSIYADRNGIIWLCGWHGLSKVNKQEQQFQSAEVPILKSDLFNLLAGIQDDPFDKNIAWIIVSGLGIIKHDKSADKVVQWYYHEYHRDYMWTWPLSLFTDREGKLWASSYGGLISIYKGNIGLHPLMDNGAYLFPDGAVPDDQGNIWLWWNRGLIKFLPRDGSYISKIIDTSDGKSSNQFHQAKQVDRQTMLATSDQGLFTADITTFQTKHLPVKGFSNKFTSLEVIGHHAYIGGEDGLIKYNLADHTVTRIGENEGIINLNEGTLLADSSGRLWIYALNGLFCYDPPKNELKKFTSADGIYYNSNDRAQLFQYGNNIYIGYRMAFTRFDPLQVDVNNNKAVPFITEIKIGGSSQKIFPDSFSRASLTLRHQHNNISFDFTAIDYTNSERITFAYKLEGFDKDWIPAGTRRSVTYSNLRGGHYTFKVKAANSSGLWNDEAATFRFHIRPALREQWWFWPSLAAVFATLVIALARRRVNTIRKREQEKTAINKSMAELETQLLRSQMNPHFIFNSLNSIQKYIWENKEEDAAEYLASFAKLIRAILENSRKEFITLKEELDVMKLYIELEHRRSNGKFDYRISVDSNIAIESILIPPLLLQPYIENAIWHGMNKKLGQGHLDVGISQQQNILTFVIDDDGVGRAATAARTDDKKSLGMEITRQRIGRLQDSHSSETGIRIIDKEKDGVAAGTTIIVTIPVKYTTHA